MNSLFSILTLLADDPDLKRAAEQTTEDGGGGGGLQQMFWFMMPVLAVMLVLQIMMRRNESSEKTKRDELIGTLKKNDPVTTIGGIKGTFVSASEDKTEVTIKVDDNTRLKIEASAIREFTPKKGEEEAKS
ncbi:MAG: preprotein translocase subunit YajC [Planctomycetaceae bacterium]|nr:preprotein translocase subunit YajC [Planctomycetaceae bacterium]